MSEVYSIITIHEFIVKLKRVEELSNDMIS